MRLSVVVPAYNEGNRLPSSLRRMVAYLAASPAWLPAEIVIVDDGSTDDTAALAGATAAAADVEIRCLRHHHNRGKGAAVRTGFAAARGELILLSDADLATPIEELERLAGAVSGGVAIGSRAVDRQRIETPQPWYRDVMGRVFNLAVRTLAVGGVHDTQCGFKLFRGDLGRSLSRVQRIDGFAFDVELLVRATHLGYEIREVPVRWRHVETSSVRPVVHSVEMLGDLLRIWWWRLTGRLSGGEDPSP
jgi:dolichyl-phosphate beta-glucosyltransferase